MIAIVVARDLMRRSRLEAAAKEAGLEAVGATEGTPAVVIADVTSPEDVARVDAHGAPVVAVVSHVDTAAIDAAERAGFTVVTRATFARRGPQILRDLLS